MRVSREQYRLAPDVLAVRVGQEMVLWVASTGDTHLLDPMAAAVLQQLELHPVPAAAAELAQRFDTPVEAVLTDVRDLVDRLVEQDVLVDSA